MHKKEGGTGDNEQESPASKVLVIAGDNDRPMRIVLGRQIETAGYKECRIFGSLQEARDLIDRAATREGGQEWRVILLTDGNLDDGDGTEVVAYAKEHLGAALIGWRIITGNPGGYPTSDTMGGVVDKTLLNAAYFRRMMHAIAPPRRS